MPEADRHFVGCVIVVADLSGMYLIQASPLRELSGSRIDRPNKTPQLIPEGGAPLQLLDGFSRAFIGGMALGSETGAAAN